MTSISCNDQGRNYSKQKPVHGQPCPNCGETMQMLTMRTKKENYKKSMIQMCPTGCRVVSILEPVIPITHKLSKKKTHNANIETLLSVDLVQLQGLVKSKGPANDFRNEMGVYTCLPCFNKILGKAAKTPDELQITIYPITKHENRLCFGCLSNGSYVQADGILRVKQLAKPKT